jgi:hypothetical protein
MDPGCLRDFEQGNHATFAEFAVGETTPGQIRGSRSMAKACAPTEAPG